MDDHLTELIRDKREPNKPRLCRGGNAFTHRSKVVEYFLKVITKNVAIGDVTLLVSAQFCQRTIPDGGGDTSWRYLRSGWNGVLRGCCLCRTCAKQPNHHAHERENNDPQLFEHGKSPRNNPTTMKVISTITQDVLNACADSARDVDGYTTES
jgi:hypothetical protein